MKNRFRISLTSLLLLLFCCKQQAPQKHGSPLISPTPNHNLESGDIICRSGNGIWSKHFRQVSTVDKRFSHVGIVIIESGQPFVIHASANDLSGKGIVARETFSEFISETEDFAVYRMDQDPEIRNQVSANAVAHLDKPFDIQFDLATTDEIYCSELVQLSVNAATGKELITTSEYKSKLIVAVDDCYLNSNIYLVLDKSMYEKSNSLLETAHSR